MLIQDIIFITIFMLMLAAQSALFKFLEIAEALGYTVNIEVKGGAE